MSIIEHLNMNILKLLLILILNLILTKIYSYSVYKIKENLFVWLLQIKNRSNFNI